MVEIIDYLKGNGIIWLINKAKNGNIALATLSIFNEGNKLKKPFNKK